MKRNYLIVIVGQSVLIIILIIYSVVQRTNAEAAQRETLAQKEIAVKAMEMAEKARFEAEQQRKVAEMKVVEAQRKRDLLEAIRASKK